MTAVNMQSRRWNAAATGLVAATLAAWLIQVGRAGGSTTPRLAGQYRTSVLVLADTTNPALPVGYTSVGTWRFVQNCSGATCTTRLLRPSIIPGRTTVLRYSLHVVSGTTYKGKIDIPDACFEPTKTLPLGSVVDQQTVTIRPKRTSGGRVVAFRGTMLTRVATTPKAKAEGCTAGGYARWRLTSPA
jgi:hypothetical protein